MAVVGSNPTAGTTMTIIRTHCPFHNTLLSKIGFSEVSHQNIHGTIQPLKIKPDPIAFMCFECNDLDFKENNTFTRILHYATTPNVFNSVLLAIEGITVFRSRRSVGCKYYSTEIEINIYDLKNDELVNNFTIYYPEDKVQALNLLNLKSIIANPAFLNDSLKKHFQDSGF